MRVRWASIAVAGALLVPLVAHAAGYAIYEQGAAALGKGGATTASVHDASALFYNPAAVVDLGKHELLFGGTWLTTRTSFAGMDPQPGFGTTEEMKPGNFPLPTLYLTRMHGSKWAYGVGVNAPFGLGVEWKDPDTFSGRQIVTKADLRALNANASLSWAPASWLSLGGGFDMLFAKVELQKRVNFIPTTGGQPRDDAAVTLKSGYRNGTGWNAGALVKPNDRWSFGAAYRSQIDVAIDDGEAKFEQIMSGDPARDALIAANMPPGQPVKTKLKFPGSFSLGMAWKPTPEWTWELDGNWTQWTAFDALDLAFPSQPSLNQTIVENYNDSYRVSLGGEHRMTASTWRYGYYWDQAAAPTESVSPLLPDAARHGATLGYGRPLGRMWLDIYDLALFVEKRSTEGRERDSFDGVYKSFVNALGASITCSW